jgi:hypothetical protein
MDSKSIVRKGVWVRVPPRAPSDPVPLFVECTACGYALITLHGETAEFVMYLALETNQWVAILVGAACLAALVAIVVAPWRRVRAEPPIPDDVEARLLLGEDPKEIAEQEDEQKAEGPSGPRAEVFELDPERRSSA